MKVYVVVIVSLSGAEKPPTVEGVFTDPIDADRCQRLSEMADESIAATVCEAELN
jgi:hypothetical protein